MKKRRHGRCEAADPERGQDESGNEHFEYEKDNRQNYPDMPERKHFSLLRCDVKRSLADNRIIVKSYAGAGRGGGTGEEFLTGFSGLTGFQAWNRDKSSNLGSRLLDSFNPVNPLNPVNPVMHLRLLR
jgi:hypothetical protein